MRQYVFIILAMAAVIAAPWLLRPAESVRARDYGKEDVLVVISPHVETIRYEFQRGFQEWMLARHQRRVMIDWRVPGGTSEIRRYLESEYRAAFRAAWEKEGRTWSDENEKFLDKSGKGPAREAFLKSDTGVRIDVFFGGGPIDFIAVKDQGLIVARDASGQHGPAAIMDRHPDWFSDTAIPAELAGQPCRDKDLAWLGTCFSSFGICWNADILKARGITESPTRWRDLTGPAYLNQVALSDPGKSGTVVAMFEVMIQAEMQKCVKEAEAAAAGLTDAEKAVKTEEAKARGFAEGLRVIQRMAANGRYWTDSSTKIPLDVAEGDAIAGICLDFYGRNFAERLKRPDGTSRFSYHTPVNATTTSVDPVAMLRGCSNPGLASLFIEYIISPEGQRLWAFRKGTPGGPERMAIRRQPVRRDFYVPENLTYSADPEMNPYATAGAFIYQPEYTQKQFGAIRVVARAMGVITHEELKEAWSALIEHKFPAEATRLFDDVDAAVTAAVIPKDPAARLPANAYEAVRGLISDVLKGDKVQAARQERLLSEQFRERYLKVARLARGD